MVNLRMGTAYQATSLSGYAALVIAYPYFWIWNRYRLKMGQQLATKKELIGVMFPAAKK
jgi:hypothetical protein